MLKGKIKYNWQRPISIGFFLLVSALGFYGISLWLYGGLPFLFDTGDVADIFPKILAVLFAGIGTIATIFTWRTGTTKTRIDQVNLNEAYSYKYTNGLLVSTGGIARFYTDNAETILRKGYVRTLHKFHKDGTSNWEILYN